MTAARGVPPSVPRGIGGAVAIAQRALLPLLGDALASEGVATPDWFGLSRLARQESATTRASFRDDLANALESEELADVVIGNLIQADLATTAGAQGAATIALSAAGAALYERISAVITAQTEELLEPFAAGDVEITVRTLLAIVDHANAIRGK